VLRREKEGLSKTSEAREKTTGTAPPTPQPVKNRKAASATIWLERAKPRVQAAFTSIDARRIGFLP